MRQGELLGVRVDCGTREELIKAARELRGVGGRIYTVNPLMLMGGVKQPAVARVLNRATLCIPDGIGVRWALRTRGIPTDVVCGVELGECLLAEGSKVGFIGGRPGVGERAFRRISQRYRGLSAAFIMDGYSYTEERLCALLREHRPMLLYVCLGTPRQELLIDRVSQASPQTLCIGLGGSFDIYAQDKARAPEICRRMRLEWMYRMLREPRRLARVPELVRFILLSMKETRKIKCTKNREKTHEN